MTTPIQPSQQQPTNANTAASISPRRRKQLIVATPIVAVALLSLLAINLSKSNDKDDIEELLFSLNHAPSLISILPKYCEPVRAVLTQKLANAATFKEFTDNGLEIVEITDVTVNDIYANATWRLSTGETATVALLKEGDAWKLCPNS